MPSWKMAISSWKNHASSKSRTKAVGWLIKTLWKGGFAPGVVGETKATYDQLWEKFPAASDDEFENTLFELLMDGWVSEPRPECYQATEPRPECYQVAEPCKESMEYRFCFPKVEQRALETLPEDYLGLS
ncbi:MAG: hypothetical protein ACFFB3_10000 [Candidatus Hodarchaeota archaeon]